MCMEMLVLLTQNCTIFLTLSSSWQDPMHPGLSPMHTFPATQVAHHNTKPSKGSDIHCPPLTHSAREEEKQSNMSKSAGHKKEHSFSRKG